MLPVGIDGDDFHGSQSPLHFPRQTHDHRSWWNFCSWREHCPSADDALLPDIAVIKNACAYPDEAPSTDSAPMEDDAVANGDLFLNDRGPSVGSDVNHGEVLNIGSRTDFYGENISSYDGVGPDTTVIAQNNVPDDDRRFMDENPFANGRDHVLIWFDHALKSSFSPGEILSGNTNFLPRTELPSYKAFEFFGTCFIKRNMS